MDDDRQLAERVLLKIDDEKMKYLEERERYISDGGKYNELESGNPTERAAMRGADFDASYPLLPWIQAVGIVERTMSDRKKLFIDARRLAEKKHCNGFRRGRPGWVIITQRYYISVVEKKYLMQNEWISERTLKTWWKDIIALTATVANKIKNKMQHDISRKP